MLTVAINGVHESAHATQSQVTSSYEKDGLHSEIARLTSACTPLEQHKDYDGCDTCVNCACHASYRSILAQLQPLIYSALQASDPSSFYQRLSYQVYTPAKTSLNTAPGAVRPDPGITCHLSLSWCVRICFTLHSFKTE
jgi:hypothetical protein